ncbi:hypothetical protein CTheo_7984 [Ceratobasidium theobromae]|uniref:Uncharacterized protein n=1 Tax=Ceratobasidium theobromae TaxID=1582974 RepID=A0A5N5Q9V7_9AGAM|nr:hypothetical protein CTheo_7984 [Ceratobasidium theobromae]
MPRKSPQSKPYSTQPHSSLRQFEQKFYFPQPGHNDTQPGPHSRVFMDTLYMPETTQSRTYTAPQPTPQPAYTPRFRSSRQPMPQPPSYRSADYSVPQTPTRKTTRNADQSFNRFEAQMPTREESDPNYSPLCFQHYTPESPPTPLPGSRPATNVAGSSRTQQVPSTPAGRVGRRLERILREHTKMWEEFDHKTAERRQQQQQQQQQERLETNGVGPHRTPQRSQGRTPTLVSPTTPYAYRRGKQPHTTSESPSKSQPRVKQARGTRKDGKIFPRAAEREQVPEYEMQEPEEPVYEQRRERRRPEPEREERRREERRRPVSRQQQLDEQKLEEELAKTLKVSVIKISWEKYITNWENIMNWKSNPDKKWLEPWEIRFPTSRIKDQQDIEMLTKDEIEEFLMSESHSIGKSRKERIRADLLYWHPDKLGKWLHKFRPSSQPLIRARAGVVARHLTDLLTS